MSALSPSSADRRASSASARATASGASSLPALSGAFFLRMALTRANGRLSHTPSVASTKRTEHPLSTPMRLMLGIGVTTRVMSLSPIVRVI